MAFGRMSTRQPAEAPISAINVTPLVDVMLVLVVIFILAAPMLAASLRVQLPRVQGAAPLGAAQAARSVQIELDAKGRIRLQGQAGSDEQLRHRLRQLARAEPDAELQLRADAAVPYGRVVQVMGWAHAAGLSRVGFISLPDRS